MSGIVKTEYEGRESLYELMKGLIVYKLFKEKDSMPMGGATDVEGGTVRQGIHRA